MFAGRQAVIVGVCFAIMCGPHRVVASDKPETILPTKACRSFFLLPLELDGRADRTLWLIYDTGAATTVIDPDSLAAMTKWQRGDRKRIKFDNLQCGDVTLRGLRARVQELDHIGRALGHPVDGILGYTAFSKVLLTLDYNKMEMRVQKGELPAPDNREVFRLLRKEKKRPWLNAYIGKRRLPILIDSGSSSGFSFNDADRWDWQIDPVTVSASTHIRTVAKKKAGRLAGDINVAGAVFPQPILQITKGTELIGTKVMKNFTWTFDQKNRRVRIVRTNAERLTTPSLHGTGVLFAPRERGFEIIHLVATTPAANAGLKTGDLVTAIDGVPVFERECQSSMPSDDNAKTIVYTYERDGRGGNVTIPMSILVP